MRSGRPAGVALFWIALGLGGIAYVVRHMAWGLERPVPWPDEGSFLWVALAFADTGSLLTPQINPERDVLWMPPGYMLVQGAIFRLTGFSLEWARALSCAYVLGAWLCLAAAVRRLPLAPLHAIALIVFLHAPIVMLVGNAARMEALVVLMAAGALLLIQSGRMPAGVALASIAPLVHPNGAFLGLAALLHVGARCSVRREGPGPLRAWALAALPPVLAWLAYAAYVGAHWAAFQNDMLMQLDLKAQITRMGGGQLGRLTSAPVGLGLALGAIGIAFGLARRSSSLFLLAWAAPLLALCVLMAGWLYDVYPALAWLLLTIAGAELARDGLRALGLAGLRSEAGGVAVGLGILTLSTAWLFGGSLLDVSRGNTWVAIGGGAPRYITPDDRERVGRVLRELRAEPEPVSVQMFPWSDALLFESYQGDGLRFLQPTFSQVQSDVVIVHHSVHLPDHLWTAILLRAAFKEKIADPIDSWAVLHRRDGTEQWLIYRRDRVPEDAPAVGAQATPRSPARADDRAALRPPAPPDSDR